MTNERTKPGRRRRRVATYGPTAVVLLLAALIVYGLMRERNRDGWVRHTRNVQIALERTLSDMRDAEAAQRGYILTGDTMYIAPVLRGVTSARDGAERLRQLTADNPIQQQRVAALTDLIERRSDRLRMNLDLRTQGHGDVALENIREGAGRILMDSLREHISVMQYAEDTLLARRESNTAKQERVTLLVVLIGSALAAAFALSMNLMLRAFTTEQVKNAAVVATQNEQLIAQAGDLAQANDMLADQAIELEHQAEHLKDQALELEMQRDELQAATTQLQTRTEAAETANRAKTDFLRAMSHELRTPLNAIGGYAQLIELGIRGPVTEEQHQDLARITRSQRHLLSLINDILNYAKLEAGHVTYQTRDVPIHEVVNAMDELVRPQMLAKNIIYHCDAGPAELVVRTDPEKALQIMLNLLSNAVKFTPSEGTISVWVDRPDGMAAIRVRDTGIGIPRDRQNAIFEPFVQVDRTHTGPSEGTGLGLSIARDLARGMKGDLRVDSAPGAGSTFTVLLPVVSKDGNGSA